MNASQQLTVGTSFSFVHHFSLAALKGWKSRRGNEARKYTGERPEDNQRACFIIWPFEVTAFHAAKDKLMIVCLVNDGIPFYTLRGRFHLITLQSTKIANVCI